MKRRILSALLALVMVMTLLPAAAMAETVTSGTCGENVTWSFDETTGTLTISGTGAMEDYSEIAVGGTQPPWYAYRNVIYSAIIEEGVTHIGDGAFYDAYCMDSVTIPDSVTSIGAYAFYQCCNLTSLDLPDGLTEIGEWVFYHCCNVSVVTVPANLGTVSANAFRSCLGLEQVDMPGVYVIDTGAFQDCASLKAVDLPTVMAIEAKAFQGSGIEDVTLYPTLNYIEESAFRATKLKEIEIPDNTFGVGAYAFAYCTDLTCAVLGKNMMSLEDHAFTGCTSLSEVVLPTSIGYLASGLFEDCSALKEIFIPGGVIGVYSRAFANCTNLKQVFFEWQAPGFGEDVFLNDTLTVYYPQGVDTWTAAVMQDYGGDVTWKALCREHNYVNWVCQVCGMEDPNRPITSGTCGANTYWKFDEATGTLTISGEGPMDDYNNMSSMPWLGCLAKTTTIIVEPGVTTVGNWAFAGPAELTKVVLPEGLTRIGSHAFSMCFNLQQIMLPQSLTEIGNYAFEYCATLPSITIPASVRTIGSSLFFFCEWLSEIWFEGDAPEIGENGSYLSVSATAYYPEGNETWTEEVRTALGGEVITWVAVEMPKIIRIAGADRIGTSLMLADQLKEVLGVEKFDSVIVASALNFPDALTGSYLAAVKNAPILLTYEAAHSQIRTYIQENLTPGGMVYILGGESAVSEDFKISLEELGIDYRRVAGSDRFGTNLEIMKEAGVSADQPVLIATAINFADSLSASAAGLPMVLVYGSLREDQKEFLETTSKNFIIIGGTSAVSESLEAELRAIGSVERLAGSGRYQTSVMVAQKFVRNPDDVVLAYARNFPDGLCGGPLAYALGAPLILTDNYDPSEADKYVDGIAAGIVVGGTGLISEDTARAIFDHPADTGIIP